MFNLVWFLMLVPISIGIIIYTYRNTDFNKNLSVYFFTAGLSFMLEYVVLIIGDAYSYYPNVFSSQWYDDVFGSSLSQALFIPSILMLIAAFRIRMRWVLIIIAGIYLIEELFIKLGIYEHNWWRSWYTSIILFFSVFVIKWWRQKTENPSLAIRFITIYMATTTTMQAITFYMQVIFNTHMYKLGWFYSPYQDHVAISASKWFFYALLLTVIILFAYNYLALIALFIGDYLFNMVLIRMEILHIRSDWVPIIFGITIVICVGLIKKLDKYLFPQ